jgi:hypothetical protein
MVMPHILREHDLREAYGYQAYEFTVAFYKSKAWADLAPQRDKAARVIRRYVVEAEK